MAVTNPNILTRPIVSATGTLTAAQQVVLNDNRNLETVVTQTESSLFGWNFNSTITDGSDPGSGFVALNNTDKSLATIISFNVISATGSARFDEMLGDLAVDDRVYLQQRDASGTNISFRVTAAPDVTATRVNLTGVVEQNEGPANATFANNAFILVKFFFTGRTSASGLPQDQTDWLAQTSSQQIQTTSVTNIAPSVNDVLIWRRSAIVNQADINLPNIGVAIAEANRQSDGTFDRASGTATYDDDLANAYIYIGITDGDIASLTLSQTFLEARRSGELVYSQALSDLVQTPLNTGQFRYFRTTNNVYHYVTADVLEVVTRTISNTTQFNYNSPAGDFTVNVSNLPLSAVSDDFRGRVRGTSDNVILTAADRVKLTGLLVSTSISGGQNLTVLYKDGDPSPNISDYDKTWNTANPVLANFGAERIVSLLVDNNITVSSISGGATLGQQLLWIPGKYIYKVTLPAEISTGTPTSHLPIGVVETFLPTGFNDNYKIQRENVEANLLSLIDAHGTAADISSLETKVNNLFPLTPDVNILINWANIYDPIHGAATVDIVDGYSLIADHRSATQKYESTGVTFGTATDVITYTGLSENLHRSFGFALPQTNTVTLTGLAGTANIPVNGTAYLATFNTSLTTTASDFVTTHATALSTAGVTVTSNADVLTFVSSDPSVLFTITDPVNVTGTLGGTLAVAPVTDKILMWIVDGATNIPFVDVTSAGNIRINNFTPEETTASVVSNRVFFLTKTSGPATVSQGTGTQRFTMPNFPSGSTDRSRTLQIEASIFVNGSDSGAGRSVEITIPVTNTAQARRTISDNVYLGPLFGNRTVSLTVGYEFIVVGLDLVIDLDVESAPSDVSVDFEESTAAYLSYTAQNTVARVDNFLSVTSLSGTYTFTGQQEFILSMRPVIGSDGEQTGFLEVVPAAVGSNGSITQLNDTDVRIPVPLWSDIQVADDIGFKTFVSDHYFRHSEVAGLLLHRTERWAYGLARLQTVNAGHSFTEAVDLASGSTVGGVPISTGGASRTWQDAQSFVAANVVNVNLPGVTTLNSFVFIEVTWHTGVGTATDNNNRNYTEMGSMAAIINGSDAEIILGGRGRGAENYGIEVTVPASGAATSLGLTIINLNDLGGATLPTGSLITAVRFY